MILYMFAETKTNIMNQSEKLKSIPVYLPQDKHEALTKISKQKRVAKTRLIEQEIDKLIKRENIL